MTKHVPIIVAAFDPDGLPRCWGSALTESEAREECDKQLSAYRQEKASVGDTYLSRAEFTFQSFQGGARIGQLGETLAAK